jgi:hypothetical protein
MPIREIEECSYKSLILLQQAGFIYFGVSGKSPDMVFDRLEANQDDSGREASALMRANLSIRYRRRQRVFQLSCATSSSAQAELSSRSAFKLRW